MISSYVVENKEFERQFCILIDWNEPREQLGFARSG